jgi:hypothetical protein
MARDPGRLDGLTRQFDALAGSLDKCPYMKKRKQSLRPMKVLLDEIDGLILSDLERDDQDTTSRCSRPTKPQLDLEQCASRNAMARWK